MRLQPSPLFSGMAGKEGERVFSLQETPGGLNIQTSRKFTKPRNPRSPAQIEVRETLVRMMAFFDFAETTTDGGTTFSRPDFLAEVADCQRVNPYRGCRGTGVYACLNRWIGMGVRYRNEPDVSIIALDGVLPQNTIDEDQLIEVIVAYKKIVQYMLTTPQRQRVGYV